MTKTEAKNIAKEMIRYRLIGLCMCYAQDAKLDDYEEGITDVEIDLIDSYINKICHQIIKKMD